jgi:hypothetical protein
VPLTQIDTLLPVVARLNCIYNLFVLAMILNTGSYFSGTFIVHRILRYSLFMTHFFLTAHYHTGTRWVLDKNQQKRYFKNVVVQVVVCCITAIQEVLATTNYE